MSDLGRAVSDHQATFNIIAVLCGMTFVIGFLLGVLFMWLVN